MKTVLQNIVFPFANGFFATQFSQKGTASLTFDFTLIDRKG
jgi:hypothetical protein